MILADSAITAEDYCALQMESILGSSSNPDFNEYDIREACEVPPLCYDLSNSDLLMNNATIQAKLGVSGRKWVECDTQVHLALTGDWMISLSDKVAALLETGFDILVYSGDKDFVCNWRGGEAWTNEVSWSR